MDSRTKITGAEWAVMEVFWKQKKASAGQAIKALRRRRDWNAKTIRTLVSRLLDKQSIVIDRMEDRQFIYRPGVKKEQCIRTAVSELAEKVGREGLGVAAVEITRRATLTKQQKTELRKIIKSKT